MTEVRPLHPSKANSPILVTEFGMVIDVKPEQPEKAPSPILVTEFGIVTDVKPLQSSKTLFSIIAAASPQSRFLIP